MRKIFENTIIGDPVAKGRPRFTRTGRAYTPKKTRDAEDKIRFMLQCAASVHNNLPVRTPIHIVLTFYLRRPKRLQKKSSTPDAIPHDKRPDLDNLTKLFIDACNGVIFVDDGQIYEIICSKWYVASNDEPRTKIEVWTT